MPVFYVLSINLQKLLNRLGNIYFFYSKSWILFEYFNFSNYQKILILILLKIEKISFIGLEIWAP